MSRKSQLIFFLNVMELEECRFGTGQLAVPRRVGASADDPLHTNPSPSPFFDKTASRPITSRLFSRNAINRNRIKEQKQKVR